MKPTSRATAKPLIDWQARSASELFFIARNSAYPALRSAAKAELDRRRAALPDSTKIKAVKEA